MSNSVVTAYRTHQAAVDARTGESAEIEDICEALAECLRLRLADLPIPPLRGVYSTPPAQVAVLPCLAVIEGDTDQELENSCWRLYTHHIDLMLLCGPAAGDPATMRAIARPYLYAVDLVLMHNQSLDGRVRRIVSSTARWGTIPYAGAQWYGRNWPLLVETQAAMLPEWIS
jgi:hypothetical protein